MSTRAGRRLPGRLAGLLAAAAALAALAALVAGGALAGATAVAPGGSAAQTQKTRDTAAARKAALRVSDLPGAWKQDDPQALAFLTARTGQAACDPSLAGLTVTGASDSAVWVGGPIDVQSRVRIYGEALQAGEALVREARAESARCVRLRMARLGFTLTKLEVQDVPSLGVGAVRFRVTLLLPARPQTPIYADHVLAVRGRAVLGLWVVSVGAQPALAAGTTIAATLLQRLPVA